MILEQVGSGKNQAINRPLAPSGQVVADLISAGRATFHLRFAVYDLRLARAESRTTGRAVGEKSRRRVRARDRNFPSAATSSTSTRSPPSWASSIFRADSWYRESVCLSADAAARRGKVLAAQGADIVDLGAESTLAHAARVGGGAQNSKLIPVIQALRAAKIPVSVETYSPAVTRACSRSRRKHFESHRQRGVGQNFPYGRRARCRRHHLFRAGQKRPRGGRL